MAKKLVKAGSSTIGRVIEDNAILHEACALRSRGYTYDEIIDKIGFDGTSGALQKRVAGYLRRNAEADVTEERLLISRHIDDISRILEPKVAKGDLRAIDRATKLIELQVKMLDIERKHQDTTREIEAKSNPNGGGGVTIIMSRVDANVKRSNPDGTIIEAEFKCNDESGTTSDSGISEGDDPGDGNNSGTGDANIYEE